MPKFPFFTLFLVVLTACSQMEQRPSDLESALLKVPKNRVELEKVLARYSDSSKDSLKFKAAVFLIQNMPGYFYYEGKGVTDFSNYFKALKQSNSEPVSILDSIYNIYGSFSPGAKRYDIETIDSAYLCENIELAFNAWRGYPWSAKYSFEDFCEYILPYRTGNETLTNWRSAFLEKYASILDSVKSTNPFEVAKILRDSIIRRQGDPRFTMTRPTHYPTLDALSSMYTAGSCADLAQFVISLFRTFGIASSEDIMPIRGDANVGHSWVALFNNEGVLYNTDFFGEMTYVSETMINRLSAKPKVYRQMFSLSNDQLKNQEGFIPDELSQLLSRTVDVTKMYANNLDDLQLQRANLYETKTTPSIVYLCIPSWRNWVPVAWCKPDKNGDVTFKDVDGGSILRVGYFDNREMKFLSPPFYMNRQTKELVFVPEDDKADTESVTLYSKFTLNREIMYRRRLMGGVFEGSNNRAFTNPDTLFVIKNRPFRLFTEAGIHNNKTYRFVRYKGPADSYCNIAEMEFYSGIEELTGKVFGTPGAQKNNPKYEFASASDGLTETSFDHSTPNDGWVGIAFERPGNITKIRYAPRNYDNYIRLGNEYELFVSKKNGWVSLGRKTASSDSINYDKVPRGALLYLKNHAGGQEERIFLMKDGWQLFR